MTPAETEETELGTLGATDEVGNCVAVGTGVSGATEAVAALGTVETGTVTTGGTGATGSEAPGPLGGAVEAEAPDVGAPDSVDGIPETTSPSGTPPGMLGTLTSVGEPPGEGIVVEFEFTTGPAEGKSSNEAPGAIPPGPLELPGAPAST